MWWRDAVVYQIYPRSFADSNGDGVGDLPGITSRLDHLAWLGVDTVWLSPVHPSPNADWGYDVADYQGIHPDLGTIDDMDALLAAAAQRGIRVLLDLVPNHTSDAHPWFVDACTSRDAEHRDFYVWADPVPDADGTMGPPNNWVSNFGGPAWTLHEPTGQYFLHNFLDAQPDLNWWSDGVRDAFDDLFRFWFDRGVAGFRIDVCHMVVKDADLRDNPPSEDDDHFMVRIRGQRQVYNAERPEVHDVIRRWRGVAREFDPERLLMGEVYLHDPQRVAPFYGAGDDELQLAFSIPMVHTPYGAGMADVVAQTEASLPLHGWPCWTGSNHDAGHFATRWCEGDADKIRVTLMMLLTLRGTPVLYYGDEIGMPDTPLEFEQLKDPVGIRFHPYAGRDPGRTPMAWTGEAGLGFTEPGVEPWLPFGDAEANVAAQGDDPDSVLHFCRDLIALRREVEDLRRGAYERLDAPQGMWAWRRGSATVALNMSEGPAAVPGLAGTIRIGTNRRRDGEVVADPLELGPNEGVIII